MEGDPRDAGADLATAAPVDGRVFAVAVLAVVVLASLVSGNGIIAIPPESHDVFPARAVQEMHERGSWLVPWFNDHLRLQKPPVAYWLTAAISLASGHGFDALVWHARAVSVLGAIALCTAAMAMASMLVDRRAAITSGLLCAATVGVFHMGHSARPDMLYAGICAWQLAAFAGAWTAGDATRRQGAWALAFWVLAALATLTKGPQVPAMLIGAVVLWMAAAAERRRRLRRALRPLAGAAVFLVLSVPWFVFAARYAAAHGAGEDPLTGAGELAGSELRLHWMAPLTVDFYTYYPVAMVRLLLPWIILVPGAIVVCVRRSPLRATARLLGTCVLVAMIAFALGQERRHYLLPFVPLAAVLAVIGNAPPGWTSRYHRLAALLVILHALAAAGLVVAVTWVDAAAGPNGAWWRLIGLLPVAAAAIVFLRRAREMPGAAALRAWPNAAAIAFAFALVAVGTSATMWKGSRHARDLFARQASALVPPGEAMAVLGKERPLLTYYGRRGVSVCPEPDDVARLLAAAPGVPLALVVEQGRLDGLPKSLRGPVLLEENSTPSDESLLLLRIPAR